MRKKWIAAALAVFAALLLTGCFLNIDLADSFDEKTVIERSKQFVAMIDRGDYEGCAEWFCDDLKKEADAAALQELVEQRVKKPGAFRSFTGETVSGTSENGRDYAVCILIAEYENVEKVQYNVTFDTDMKVAGFYCK